MSTAFDRPQWTAPDLFSQFTPAGSWRVLDLCCRVGGAGRGYQMAGAEVDGVDIEDMAGLYPGRFHLGDAFEYLIEHAHEYDLIHFSPPCQDRIAITAGNRKRPGWTDSHVNLVPRARAALAEVRRRYRIPTVIECGVGKHLRPDLRLCGEMFHASHGLAVIRHRYFEIDGIAIDQPAHLPHRGRVAGCRHGEWFEGPYFAVYGEGGGKGTVAQWQAAMGIDWTTDRKNLAEAIPPAYTQYIGDAVRAQLPALALIGGAR